MPICNRDNGLSQQREVLAARLATPVTGESYGLIVVPFPCNVQAVYFAAYGLSGTPQYNLKAHRWLGTAGATSINLGISNVVVSVAVGISGGPQGWSGLNTLGSSLLQLQKGDVIVLGTAGTNAAADDVSVSLVVQKSQDIVQHFDLST